MQKLLIAITLINLTFAVDEERKMKTKFTVTGRVIGKNGEGLNKVKLTILNDFGQTYFKLLENTNMYVDNQKVDPVDVLFATPGARGFKDSMNDLSVDIDNPDCYGEISIPIEDKETKSPLGEINLYFGNIYSLCFLNI